MLGRTLKMRGGGGRWAASLCPGQMKKGQKWRVWCPSRVSAAAWPGNRWQQNVGIVVSFIHSLYKPAIPEGFYDRTCQEPENQNTDTCMWFSAHRKAYISSGHPSPLLIPKGRIPSRELQREAICGYHSQGVRPQKKFQKHSHLTNLLRPIGRGTFPHGA